MVIKNFKDVDKLNYGDFEIFVKELFVASGWTDAVITKVGKEYRHGDGGVDIFAYKAKRKFAIEVKQRNINTKVDVKALNQLVTGAKLAKAKNKILVTNSYFTSEVQVRALRLGVELINRDELQNLWIKRHTEIGRDIKPRKYQFQVIEQAIKQFKKGEKKILIEMATGLGKTYTVAILIKEIIKTLNKRPKVLFVAHQIEILLQSVTAFKNVLGIGTYSFSACFSGSAPEETDFVFASFDTLYGQIDNLKKETFDFIIVDEAHHTPARTYSEVVSNFSPRFLIGLTATPYRNDNINVTNFFGGANGHIGKYDLIWALKHRKLAFPKYLVLLDDLDQSRIDQLESGLTISDLDKRLFLHKKDEEVIKIIEDTVKKEKIDAVKGIVFCRNIKHIEHLLGFFKMGTVICVHSQMTDQARRDNIRKFREGEYKYILVCNLFNEGIDIPETNLLVFLRHTGSRTVWLQQLGRGLRKTPNKEYVHVLDFVGSLERLNEVRELSISVQNLESERGNIVDIEEVKDGQKEIVHDGTLNVKYNQSAAKVLELIETLKYRLGERTAIIDKIKQYRESNNAIPSMEELDNLLDVSSDQVATLFKSYFGYLKAAFDTDFDIEEMKGRMTLYVNSYMESNNNVKPSYRAISLQFHHNNLLEFTESEIEEILPDIQGNFLVTVNDPTEELDDLELTSNSIQDDFLNKYKGRINNREDIKGLQKCQQEQIKKIFKSESIFLKKLKLT